MIKSLILPEMFSGSPEDLVSLASRNTFQTIRYALKRNRRVEKNMNMVGHYGESPKRVLMQFALASIKRSDHATRNAWLVQPKRPRASIVQRPVGFAEIFASRGATLPVKSCNDVRGKGTVKPPSEENRSLTGVPVRQMPNVVSHRFYSRMVTDPK
jgi:hypothetical protein